MPSFCELFEKITGHPPFPWQEALFEELAEKRFRRICDVPTGLGKTSIIAIWLLALVHHGRTGTLNDFPRRLIYTDLCREPTDRRGPGHA